MYLLNKYVIKSYYVWHCSRCWVYRVNKTNQNPYASKHPYSYLTRTYYILVRKRNSEKNKNKNEKGEGGEEEEKEEGTMYVCVCIYIF